MLSAGLLLLAILGGGYLSGAGPSASGESATPSPTTLKPARTAEQVGARLAGQTESLLGELGIPAHLIAIDTTVFPVRVRVDVPRDLPLVAVNLTLTDAVEKVGGQVIEGREDGAGTVRLRCGRDSTVTTLYLLRRAATAVRRHGDIGLIIDQVVVPDGEEGRGIWDVEQRLTLVFEKPMTSRLAAWARSADHQLVAAHRLPLDEREPASAKVRRRLAAAGDGGYLDHGDSTKTIERRLWALAERAAADGAAVGVLRDRPHTRAALRAVLPRLERRGYRFVSAASLLP